MAYFNIDRCTYEAYVTYMHAHACIYMHVYIHHLIYDTHMLTYLCIHRHKHTYTYTQTRTNRHIHTYIDRQIHTYITKITACYHQLVIDVNK